MGAERMAFMAYDEKYTGAQLIHSVILEGRERLTVSGVEAVESFDEAAVVMNTVKGTLVIRGQELHMEKLSLDSGEAALAGHVDSLEYEDEARVSEGFLARIFK